MKFPSWAYRWLGLIFAGYGILIALILNRFIGGQGWSNFTVVFLLAGILGAVGYSIGRDRQGPV
jgi:branched-subunit amino acid transport protein